MKPTVDIDLTQMQDRINAIKARLAAIGTAYVYKPVEHRGEQLMATRGQPAYVEIVERKKRHDPADVGPGALIRPNEVRVNGTPLLIPAGEDITVHEISLNGDELAKVTLTMWVRRVVIDSEAADG